MTELSGEIQPLQERLARLLWQQDMERRQFTPPVTWDVMVETAPAKRIFRDAAAGVLSDLGVQRLYFMVGSNNRDAEVWAHRYTLGDRVVSVSTERKYPRDVPLFRIRAAESSSSREGY